MSTVYLWNPWNWEVFFLVVLSLMAIALVVLGAMTTYFGSGKSRIVGAVLLAVGVVVGILTIFLSLDIFKPDGGLIETVIIPTFYYAIAGVVGVAIGLLVFLAAIMKT